MLKNKNSIGLKALSFLVHSDEIQENVGNSLTKALFNAIILNVYYMYSKTFYHIILIMWLFLF